MPPPGFGIDVADDGELLVLRLVGELDIATVPVVQDAVDEHCTRRRALVVDLSRLAFLDSTGLRLLIELQRREDGTRVAFVAPPEPVARVLDMTGIRSVLNWVSGAADARDARV